MCWKNPGRYTTKRRGHRRFKDVRFETSTVILTRVCASGKSGHVQARVVRRRFLPRIAPFSRMGSPKPLRAAIHSPCVIRAFRGCELARAHVRLGDGRLIRRVFRREWSPGRCVSGVLGRAQQKTRRSIERRVAWAVPPLCRVRRWTTCKSCRRDPSASDLPWPGSEDQGLSQHRSKPGSLF